jgi:hypothetical protein
MRSVPEVTEATAARPTATMLKVLDNMVIWVKSWYESEIEESKLESNVEVSQFVHWHYIQIVVQLSESSKTVKCSAARLIHVPIIISWHSKPVHLNPGAKREPEPRTCCVSLRCGALSRHVLTNQR